MNPLESGQPPSGGPSEDLPPELRWKLEQIREDHTRRERGRHPRRLPAALLGCCLLLGGSWATACCLYAGLTNRTMFVGRKGAVAAPWDWERIAGAPRGEHPWTHAVRPWTAEWGSSLALGLLFLVIGGLLVRHFWWQRE